MPSSLPSPLPQEVYTTCAFLGFLACAIPFAWHLEAWNTGTCLYMLWVGIGCLNQFVNSIVWNGNAINWAPVWCDISSRIILGASFAIPACALCINRRLYHIASCSTVTVSRAEKRRAVMVDLAIGLVYPLVMTALQYIVQGHRFNILEDIGCAPFTYNTPPAFFLVYAQPIIVGCISAVYSGMSIRLFYKRNMQFNELLSSHRNLSSNRYIRLMALAGIDMLLTVPLAIYCFVANYKAGVFPWLGWEDTHFGFSRVDQFPAIVWRNNTTSYFSVEFNRWAYILCAFVFFAFFGFADEAKKHYKSAVETVARKVGYSTFTLTGSRSGATDSTLNGGFSSKNFASSGGKIRPVPPVHVHGEMLQRQRSIDSFTNVSVSFMDAGGLMGDDEKKGTFSPEASIGRLSLNDVGGTLADYSSEKESAPSTPGSNSTASSTLSTPALSREPSSDKLSDRNPV